MADVTLSSILSDGGSSAPQREEYFITASNASFPIPSWAQGGKGVVYVTGCGGGGGGAAATNGASAGGWARRHPLLIPSGETTMALTIGAGGVSPSAGGNTEIAFGSTNVLRLRGGGIGVTGFVDLWSTALSAWRVISVVNETLNFVNSPAIGSFSLGRGNANSGASPASGFFGAATIAEDALGYGAGGGVAKKGAPGFLLLEFVEGK